MPYIGKHIRKSTQQEHDALDAAQDALPTGDSIGSRALPHDDVQAIDPDADSDCDDRDEFDDMDDEDMDDEDTNERSYSLPFYLQMVLLIILVIIAIPVLFILWLLALLGNGVFHMKIARKYLNWIKWLTYSDSGDDEDEPPELSKEKRFIVENLSDEEVHTMLELMLEKHPELKLPHAPDADGSDSLHLDAATMAKVESFRKRKTRLNSREAHWLASVESLMRCRVQKPKGFDGLTAPQIYRKLYDFLTERFLPEAFILSVVPELVYYVVNGKLRRPLLLVGAPGCGKTTSIRIIGEALGMASYHYDAVTRDSSHSLFGEASSYQDPDYGDLVSGIISTGVLNPIFHIDEPDKTSSPTSRSAFQDEALSLCDGAHATFTDTFLGFPLPLKGIILCFTANTTDTISQPLLDRCEVVRFKDIEESRVQDIIAHYAENERRTLLYNGALELDAAALRKAVAALYDRGVHSIRQHQKLVDRAFCEAFSAYVFSEAEHPASVVVDDDIYAEAMNSGEFGTVKKAGF